MTTNYNTVTCHFINTLLSFSDSGNLNCPVIRNQFHEFYKLCIAVMISTFILITYKNKDKKNTEIKKKFLKYFPIKLFSLDNFDFSEEGFL